MKHTQLLLIALLMLVAFSTRTVSSSGTDSGQSSAGLPAASSTSGGVFYPLTPARILDTRTYTGGLPGKVGPGQTIAVQVTGQGGVPASGVSAVVMNVTVTEPTAASHLTIYPSDAALPLASNLNFVAGQTVPNLVTVKVGADGKVKAFNNSGETHVIFDVAGYYGIASISGAGDFVKLASGSGRDTVNLDNLYWCLDDIEDAISQIDSALDSFYWAIAYDHVPALPSITTLSWCSSVTGY